MNKAVPLALALIVMTCLGTTYILPAKAQSSGVITIRADGSVDPSTAPINRNGNIYTLTRNFVGRVSIEKNNMVFDGLGHTTQYNEYGNYSIYVNKCNNVTIQNVIVVSAHLGILLQDTNNSTITNTTSKSADGGLGLYLFGDCSGNVISENNLTGILLKYLLYSNKNTIIGNRIMSNNVGIIIEIQYDGKTPGGNVIAGNQIENNIIGMQFGLSMEDYYSDKPNPFYMDNQIYYNNFVNNTQNVVNEKGVFNTHECVNIWDNGTIGNYWSNYNSTDTNSDGIGDTPYVIDGNNTDNYPLMSPVNISEVLSNMLPSLMPSPSPSPTFTSPSPSPTATPTPSPSPTPAPTPTPSLNPSPTIPEFPPFMVMSFIMAATVLSAIFYRANHNKLKQGQKVNKN